MNDTYKEYESLQDMLSLAIKFRINGDPRAELQILNAITSYIYELEAELKKEPE